MTELNATEMVETNGGELLTILAMGVAAAVIGWSAGYTWGVITSN